MMTAAELTEGMKQFYGTEQWFRVHAGILLTEGTKWVAENAGAYWLIADIPWSIKRLIHSHTWGMVKMAIEPSGRAKITVDDGNGHVYYTQEVEYTDFPLEKFSFWCVSDGNNIIVMLPSEY